MRSGLKVNRKVVNRSYDKSKIPGVVAYARSLNERIVAYDKSERHKIAMQAIVK